MENELDNAELKIMYNRIVNDTIYNMRESLPEIRRKLNSTIMGIIGRTPDRNMESKIDNIVVKMINSINSRVIKQKENEYIEQFEYMTNVKEYFSKNQNLDYMLNDIVNDTMIQLRAILDPMRSGANEDVLREIYGNLNNEFLNEYKNMINMFDNNLEKRYSEFVSDKEIRNKKDELRKEDDFVSSLKSNVKNDEKEENDKEVGDINTEQSIDENLTGTLESSLNSVSDKNLNDVTQIFENILDSNTKSQIQQFIENIKNAMNINILQVEKGINEKINEQGKFDDKKLNEIQGYIDYYDSRVDDANRVLSVYQSEFFNRLAQFGKPLSSALYSSVENVTRANYSTFIEQARKKGEELRKKLEEKSKNIDENKLENELKSNVYSEEEKSQNAISREENKEIQENEIDSQDIEDI